MALDYDIYGNLTAEGLRKKLALQAAVPSGQVTVGGRNQFGAVPGYGQMPGQALYSDLQQNLAIPTAAPTLQSPAVLTSAPTSVQSPSALLDARKAALNKELKTNLAISGIAQAAQFGAALIPTTSEIENKRRLKEIETEKADLEAEAAQAGLSSEEKALMQQAAIAPVQALARESRQREEAAAASMGGTSSAASQVRARRAERDALQSQAMQASLQIENADIQKAKSDLDTIYQKQQILKKEEDERIEAKGLRQRQLLGQAGQLAGGVAGLAGQVRGAQALEAVTPDQLQGLTPTQQESYLRAIQAGDTQALQMLELTRAIAAGRAA